MPFNEFKHLRLLKEGALIQPGEVIVDSEIGTITSINSDTFQLNLKKPIEFNGNEEGPGSYQFKFDTRTLTISGLPSIEPFDIDRLQNLAFDYDDPTQSSMDFAELFQEFVRELPQQYADVANKLDKSKDAWRDKQKAKGRKSDPSSGMKWAAQQAGLGPEVLQSAGISYKSFYGSFSTEQVLSLLDQGVTGEQLKRFLTLIKRGALKNN
jgi:hypothetical protein